MPREMEPVPQRSWYCDPGTGTHAPRAETRAPGAGTAVVRTYVDQLMLTGKAETHAPVTHDCPYIDPLMSTIINSITLLMQTIFCY